MRARSPSRPKYRMTNQILRARKRRPSWGWYSLKSCTAAWSVVRRYSGTRLKASRSTVSRRESSSEQSSGVKSHLWGLTTIESARSQPANGARRSGRRATTPA